MVEKQSSELLCYLNALISACLLSGTVTHRERREELRSLLTHSGRNHRKPKEGDNLFELFPQVIPRSLVRGQADHCEKDSITAPFL